MYFCYVLAAVCCCNSENKGTKTTALIFAFGKMVGLA
jgi:hypothetical protein